MKVSTGLNSLSQKLWYNGLPQYMVTFVHYCPELVDATIKHFNPHTNTIEGRRLKVNIYPEAIQNMLCIPNINSRQEEVQSFNPTKGEAIWKGMKKAQEFYNK